MSDFIEALPNGSKDYIESMREFLLGLYSKQCRNSELYFLDKTPRYYLIINEIAEIFPDAKFIFLLRNPAEILGSIISTWCENNLKKVHAYEVDLVAGPKLLSEGLTSMKNKAHVIHYHSLLTNPKKELEAVCEYLEIPFQEQMITEFTEIKPKGRMGDSLGLVNYKRLSAEPKQKWKRLLSSYIHKTYFRKYITSLDSSVLLNLGFKKEELLLEIDRVPVKKIGSLRNWFFWIRGRLILFLKLNLINRKGSKNNPTYFS